MLTSRPAVGGPTALSTDAPDTTGAFDADLLPPKRIQAGFIYRRSDAAQFGGMDSALRMALNGGLQEKLDLDAIAGDDGLLTGTNLSNNNVSAITTFAHYLSLFLYGRVDGRYCRTENRYPRTDGRWHLRPCGQRLPKLRVQVGARVARTGFGRRARVGSRSCRVEQQQAERGGTARLAARYGAAGVGRGDHHR